MPSKIESSAPEPEISDVEEEEFEEEEEEEEVEGEEEEEEVEEENDEGEEVEEEEEDEVEEEEGEEEPEEEEEEEPEQEEEEEPEQEEEEEPEQEEENDEEKSADSTLDSPSAAKKDDSEQEVESEDDGDEPRLEKTKTSLAAEAHDTSGGHCDPVNSPNEFLNTKVGDVSHVGDGDTKPQVLGKEVVASEDKGIQESFSDSKVFDSQPQKRVAVEGCIDVHKGNDEAQGGDQNILDLITPTGAEKSKPSCINEKEVAAGTPSRDDSSQKSNVLFKEETKQMDMEIGDDIKLKASSSITPQIRPRSSSPGTEFEDGNKRPAIICDFFARGWCIKGSSCKFLHQKDGVTSTSKSDKQDAPAGSKDNLAPEHRFLSSGALAQSSGYGNINSIPYDKYGSRTSTGFFSSLNSDFNTSVPSQGIPALHQTYTWAGSALSQRSSFDGDHGYYSSKSSILGHSSSPFYSRHDPESFSLPINNWEPSLPFRPSFNFSLFISSPRNQYDPLLDSIDRPNGEDRTFQDFSVAQGVITHNISHQQAKRDSVSFHQQPQYGALRPSAEAATTFVTKEENPLKPGNNANTSNAMEVDHRNLSHQADGSKPNKESKALKHFRASLVEFVKELVKPHWRDGHLSKDAHNTVVKKAVEKVLSAFQPHQIPNTAESTIHYLSSCRPKLTRLVEGYVGKYANA